MCALVGVPIKWLCEVHGATINMYTVYLITHTNTCMYLYICVLFKKSKIYMKTFKTLLHVSITRSSSGSIYCSLLKLQFKTYSELLCYVNFGAVAACHVFVSLMLHSIGRTTITRLILSSVRLAHKNTTCCHSTKVNIMK